MVELDFKTKLFLYITRANIIKDIEVIDIEKRLVAQNYNHKTKDVYIFKNYEEYKKYFLMYLDNIDEDLINLAIYTKSSKGEIIAFKDLCERIVVKIKERELYYQGLEYSLITKKLKK